MILKRLITLIIFFSMASSGLNAQQQNDFSKNWKIAEAFEKKGLTASALKEVMKIFELATTAGNEVQQVKSAMYQMKYRNMVEEDNKENNLFYIDTLAAKTKAPVKNILLSMQAELCWSYRQNNRYKFYGRTKLEKEKSNDISTWSIDKLNQTITALYQSSLKNESVLKNTSLEGLDAILEKGQNTRNLRPTLFDLLANRALSYFMSDENNLTSPAYKFILNDEKVFSPVNEFIKIKFITNDTAALFYHALILFQNLLKFHLADANPDALLDANLGRLNFVNQHGVFTNKDKLYENALAHIENSFKGNPAVAQAIFLRAQLYHTNGSLYDPLSGKNFQYEIKRAKELCDTVISMYAKSEGAINCQNLLNQINTPVLHLETEKVNLAGLPFRSLVKYKNIHTLYFRLIKTNREQLRKINQSGYDENWKMVLEMKPYKTWELNLPDLRDFQEHGTEIKIDALQPGTYIILSSINGEFSLSQNIIARQITYVSNISYIFNNKDELFILNRDNGLPIENAEVQLWQQKYDYSTRGYEEIRTEKYKSDANGYVKLARLNSSYNNSIQIKFNKDELFLDENIGNYYYNSYDQPSTKRTFLFTDRSIYRPGQTIFFKGIVVKTDSAGNKSNVIKQFQSTVNLIDVNGQKVSSLDILTNEYGSYNGRFKLPEGLLNGQFYLQDSGTNSTKYFNVEEYKRPKFFVDIKKPAGTYRINDSITVTGIAKAYAGNNIDGARVNYRVVRKVQFPPWWGWGGYFRRGRPGYPGAGEEMEITNGQTMTDPSGNFTVKFKAIPDESIDKKDQPTFYYEVSADITDLNGETRIGETSVAVAYQALQLEIITPGKIQADSINQIKIKTTNLNGIFEKATVNVVIHKLTAPGRIFRERYWEMPDLFLMSKDEYYNNFPYDVFSDEDQVSRWPLGHPLTDKTDSTKENGSWTMNKGQLMTGWYKIIAYTKDKFGEEVKSEKYIQLTDGRGQTAEQIEKINLVSDKDASEPGEKFNYSISTGFDKIWVIQGQIKMNKPFVHSYLPIERGMPYMNEIPVTETDRGGILLSYAFVKHNRVYNGSKNLLVPWSNKELHISYETFRDKVLPGSEEKWKIKISGNKKEKLAAESLISMYDASLDQFKSHNWESLQSIWPSLTESISWVKGGFSYITAQESNRISFTWQQQKPKSYDGMKNNGWNESYYGDQFIRLRGNASMAMSSRNEVLEEVTVTANAEEKINEPSPKQMKLPGNKDISADTTSHLLQPKNIQDQQVQVRKNFNETAFFFPSLITDSSGNIEFSFTLPEALTSWKMMTLAHTKELASAYAEATVITQKQLMLQPNLPRFLREGDQISLTAKIVNLGEKELSGTSRLELMNSTDNKPVDQLFKNLVPIQNFTVPAGQSILVKFPVSIPVNFNSALTWRIKAITNKGDFSDGEEASLPVLINRMLVTESMPINMRQETKKQFKFEKLINSAGSQTLSNHSLTVEYTSNPAWYAVQALPYMMEYPYECAEQQFNRYYANTLAGYIVNNHPRIRSVFETWKNLDSAALLSNLQKNEELKYALLQETPWVLDARNENQQKKNIALLFDLVRMEKEKAGTYNKMKEMQSSNGGFTWFKGGPDDRYITQYIITGIGHLHKLNALNSNDQDNLKAIIDKAIPYLDARIKEDYDQLIRYKINLKGNNLSSTAIQYLYMRSFFPQYKMDGNSKSAYNYYFNQSKKYWQSNSKYMMAMIALYLSRADDKKTSLEIIRSLKENAIYKEEMGMYWKEFTTGGFYWYQAPIESQALMIEAFTEIDKNVQTVDDLKTWLLKQKQTQNWKTTKATAEACYALLLNGSNWLSEEKQVTIELGNTRINSKDGKTETGTGYFKKSFSAEKVATEMGNISVQIDPSPGQLNQRSSSWGAVYWQYFEDLDKITSAETPLKLVKQLFKERNSANGPVLKALNEGEPLHIGDKIKVRIELRVDRNMEYIHMKDMRAACMEPLNVISEYKWQDGLGYYETTKDASTHFFFGWLPRGTYIFEYPLFITHSGNFSNGITTIQCMYAPEFASHSEGVSVKVE